MNIKALVGIFGLFMSYISALSLVQFPLNLSLAPGSDYSIQLEGNDIAAGDYVRVELWDNQNNEDVNAAVVAEEAIVGDDLKVSFGIPAEFPKTKNAFLRVFYKCHNTVSPRFIIKPNNCLNPLQPSKPSPSISMPLPGVPLNVPRVIYQSPNAVIEAASEAAPQVEVVAAPQAEAVYIVVATATIAPTSSATAQPTSSATATSSATGTATATATSASAVTSISSSTSTSSASMAKFSTSSIALVLAVVLGAMLF